MLNNEDARGTQNVLRVKEILKIDHPSLLPAFHESIVSLSPIK